MPCPTCHLFQVDFDIAQSTLASDPLTRREACFCSAYIYFLHGLGQASATRMSLQEAPLISPLMYSFHKYLWSVRWIPGSESCSFTELDLAQILTLKLSIRPGSGSHLAECTASSQASGSLPLLQAYWPHGLQGHQAQ